MKQSVLAGMLACMLLGQQTASSGSAQSTASPQQTVSDPPQQQQTIPDAPKPQALPIGSITPGKGTTPTSNGDATPDDQAAPGAGLPNTPLLPQVHEDDGPAPDLPATGEGATYLIRVGVNFVDIPFTVKDKKGQLVPGLTWRDVRVYENGLRQKMQLWTVDPFPLSVALVIDQSMTHDEMTKVNNALGALQGAFSNYDEVAVFTYNNGPQQQTDFTGGQSARLNAVLERSKGAGRDALLAGSLDGPLSQTTNINNQQFDPNTAPIRNQSGITLNAPRDVHTLNDAILAAAQATTKAGPGRRRIVYVIGDGKEYGSTAKTKDVIKYLQTNKIAVYATMVGDFKIPYTGFIDRIHLPLTMQDDILPVYVGATGGQVDTEFRTAGIARSFSRIAEEVRTQYTVGYYSREPFIDGKYRKIEVKVLRPNLTVIAKDGYYPTAGDSRPRTVQAQ